MAALTGTLGGLERSLCALRGAVTAHGVNPGRMGPEWAQLQAHARQLLGDLSSATSRIRNMNEVLYTLQGR
ncbi:hypothetical protein GPECTOR_11g223 [Gonium pectorale]|uniref:Uncharacterized protein n=1 Tax=Gonium pectorale TaxID=33097 RepID=A0A150GR13_GONPE|nr:hypothetical protein GPECTOR_11g223 [Gonium pectorale]|eukprot:KXZ51780.1 hypothetical protein GPECTOR_11g223 [Gonium pectorale]